MKSSNKSSFLKVGFVQDAHGIRGELYVKIPSKEFGWLKLLKNFELQLRDESEFPIAFTLDRAKPHKEGLIVKAKEIPDRNRAEELKGYSFSIPEDLLTSKPGEALYLREILDFEVFDQGQSIGKIASFLNNGAQDLLVVKASDGREHLVPFVEAFIEDVQTDKKCILMNLPEGLIE